MIDPAITTLDIEIMTKNVRDNRHMTAAYAIFERHSVKATLQYRGEEHAALSTRDAISAECDAEFRALALPKTARLRIAGQIIR